MNKIKNLVGTYVIDENKNVIPTSTLQWAIQLKEMRDNNTKKISEDILDNKLVSTSWLGVDHQYLNNSLPLLYETVVIKSDKTQIYREFYSTLDQAKTGHQRIVDDIKKNGKNYDGDALIFSGRKINL